MIYLTISAEILPDKGTEAQALFQRVAQYMRDNTAEVTYHIGRNISGSTRRIQVFATYETIADWDTSRAKRANDPQWQEIATALRGVVDLHNAEVQFYDVLAQA